MDENKMVLLISSMLRKCIEIETDIEKISLMTFTLLVMDVDVNTPLIKKSCEFMLKKMHKDCAWSCPFDTALCLGNLEKVGTYDPIVTQGSNTLKKWRFDGMWGRNTRDEKRLLATAYVLLFFGKELVAIEEKEINRLAASVVALWKRDIYEVGYIFKAVSFLYIASQIKGKIDDALVYQTIQMLSHSRLKNGGLKYACLSENGKSTLEINSFALISLINWKEYVSDEFIEELAAFLKTELIKSENYSDYAGICLLTIALKYYSKEYCDGKKN